MNANYASASYGATMYSTLICLRDYINMNAISGDISTDS
jgi:hypothetical protein